MTETIEEKCLAKDVKLTDQRKIVAKVAKYVQLSTCYDCLRSRISKLLDSKI